MESSVLESRPTGAWPDQPCRHDFHGGGSPRCRKTPISCRASILRHLSILALFQGGDSPRLESISGSGQSPLRIISGWGQSRRSMRLVHEFARLSASVSGFQDGDSPGGRCGESMRSRGWPHEFRLGAVPAAHQFQCFRAGTVPAANPVAGSFPVFAGHLASRSDGVSLGTFPAANQFQGGDSPGRRCGEAIRSRC